MDPYRVVQQFLRQLYCENEDYFVEIQDFYEKVYFILYFEIQNDNLFQMIDKAETLEIKEKKLILFELNQLDLHQGRVVIEDIASLVRDQIRQKVPIDD